MERTTTRNLDEIADIIQQDIDAILRVAEEYIAYLSEDDIAAKATKFTQSLLGSEDFLFNRSSPQFFKHAQAMLGQDKFKIRSEMSDAAPLSSFFDGVLQEKKPFVLGNSKTSPLPLNKLIAYFVTYASKPELEKFVEYQTRLISHLKNEVFALKRQSLSEIERICKQYGTDKVSLAKYVQKSPKSFPDTDNFRLLKNASLCFEENLGFNLELMEKISKNLQEFKGDIFLGIPKIREAYEHCNLSWRDNNNVASLVITHPEKFEDNKDLQPLRDVVALGYQAVEKKFVETEYDIGTYILSEIESEYARNIKPNSISFLFLGMIGADDKKKISALFQKRAAGNAHKIPVLIVPAYKIAANDSTADVAEVVADAGISPSQRARSFGGRAHGVTRGRRPNRG